MKQLTGPTPEMTDQRDAFDVLEGLPRKADNIGDALLPYVHDVYYEGAIGWTGHAFNVNELYDEETGEPTGEAVIFVPDDLAAEHDGETVELPDGRFVTIDLSEAVDVQSERTEFPMQAFTDFDGEAVFIRPVRVAAVLEPDGGSGTHILFPNAEDPVIVADSFADVVDALRPQLLSGLIVLHTEEETLAVNPRYVLFVTGDATGARVGLSGSRSYDVTETRDDVIAVLGP